MALLSSLLGNAANTKLVKNAQAALQNFGYKQQQQMPHTGSSVRIATSGLTSPTMSRASTTSVAPGMSNGLNYTPAYQTPNYLTSAPKSSSGSTALGSLLSSGGGGYSAPSSPVQQNPYSGMEDAAQSGYDAELSAANEGFDYEREGLLSQLSSLDRQKADSLSALDTDLKGISTEVGTQKQRSEQATGDAIGQAGSIARTTQAKNRNVLRALGILNSSAAATELTKPINEFDQERARLVRGNLQRIDDLDKFYLQKVGEGKQASREIETQYTDLVGRIQNDLRFNDRQRTQAVRDATAALQARKAEIGTQLANYQTQIGQMKSTFAAQLAQMKLAEDPSANIDSILGTALSGADRVYGSNASIVQDDEKKRRLSAYGV